MEKESANLFLTTFYPPKIKEIEVMGGGGACNPKAPKSVNVNP